MSDNRQKSVEEVLLAVHRRVSPPMGELLWAVARRSLGRARTLGWARELRRAAEELEELVEVPQSGKSSE